MTQEQRRLARHALGLRGNNKKSYRNRYLVSATTSVIHPWWGMVHQGLAVQGDSKTSKMVLYHLTYAGALLALDPGETLCPEDFPESVKGAK
jgi:hypothetical protein